MYKLRNYQQDAVDATLEHFRQSDDSAVIVLPTGAGKSLVIAELGRLARGNVVCLAHVKELVDQNHSKLAALGVETGIFSAGLGQRQLNKKTTFASVQSLAPNLGLFNDAISLLIVDECHRISEDDESQYQKVIQHFKQLNPRVRILGLTATPYRLDAGWIYKRHHWGFFRDAPKAFFEKCIYELPLRRLVNDGYLTKPIVYDAAVEQYDFSALTESLDGETDTSDLSLNKLVSKHPRVTKAICEQILELSQSRQGVMIFASTRDHANEIIGYLPVEESALVTGDTPTKERDEIIIAFKNKRLKYLVNVSVLTTGFDAPHVDVIALLRPTESVSLYQQIVGRGLRLSDNKKDCLILDYTNQGYDLYQPEIGTKKPNPNVKLVQVACPQCDFQNMFWGQQSKDGDVLEHYGRRCQAIIETPDDEQQCSYRFVFKRCPNCNEENDIAARKCLHCNHKLIDPDDTLRKALSLKDNKVLRCQAITAKIDGTKLHITYHDEDGETLKEQFDFSVKKHLKRFNDEFSRRLGNGAVPVSFSTIDEIKRFLDYLPSPDFVIAKKQKGNYWQVTERLFDYDGPYRRANEL
ncbi:DEAD/DEAH box helicase family protein [Marinomonas mediterranea]|uniref:DEAD/DEAH box helicase n=1 Tax=Marinomonas mediterranea TaxID=119864 RepID=UPI00234ACD18|nr:DEAD/DEAH box helicase [Marinomonas mediterranea]WCN12979.1 DEAD/DEAH box helicase family protein [Marinomonas mediterranea]